MDNSELQSRVHEHGLFFDNLVELVPAKFYIAKEKQENTWHYGMSKAKRAAAKQATKEHLKKAKRDRLDPDKFTSTLKLLQQQETETPDDAEKKDEAANSRLRGKESRASTYEELRERLHKRMEILRAKRNADAAVATARNAQSWQNKKKLDSQNRKRKRSSGELNAEANVVMPSFKHSKQAFEKSESGDTKKMELDEAADTFEFGRVKMGLHNDVNGKGKRKRNESKKKLLAKATKLQSEMQDPKKGQEVSMKHSWNAAVSRASGDKVYDDPDRLKQSIKREKHQWQKSSKKWEERKETVKESADAKQQVRQYHIKERKQQKKERKIAKREKKLLRPGFEGRRESFINE